MIAVAARVDQPGVSARRAEGLAQTRA